MKKALLFILTFIMVLSACAMAEGATTFESTIDWDAEYDVIVVGFGAAGGATAISAADAGAKVLLLEKAPEGEAGGNSAVCKQWVCYVIDRDQAITYMKLLRGNYQTPTDEFIEGYIDEVAKNWDWMVSLGAPNPTQVDYVEYPNYEGAGMLNLFSVNGKSDDSAAYRLVKANVEKRDNIDVWYEAPGRHLIQDPETKIIHGVVAEVDGREVNIRAKNGVVLCTGGFESNEQMLEDYVGRDNLHSLGNARYNTGDGIKMAQEVGANLWHMANIAGPWLSFMNPDTETVYFNMTVPGRDGIIVGPDGTRFTNEMISNKHGKTYFHGTYIAYPLPEYMYSIFDESVMTKGALLNAFSADNQAELEKGWIVKADTLEALAEAIDVDPEGLAAQVERYNGYCEAGYDHEFQRDPATLKAFSAEGPYYALKLTPAVINTQGGPERNIEGQVIGVNGEPIPHLYESGELGDVWSNGYQASCNIGGGQAFGRISGANAAAPKDDNDPNSVMEGKEPFVPAARTAEAAATAENEFIGEGTGKGGTPIVVKVTMDGETITAIEILEDSETEGISEPAKAQIPAAIIEAQSTEVDSITGVTLTSEGIKEAVANALAQAK